MQKIWEVITDNAYIVMFIGMILIVVGLLLLMKFNQTGGPRGVVIGLGIAGIAVYLVGRISVFLKRK